MIIPVPSSSARGTISAASMPQPRGAMKSDPPVLRSTYRADETARHNAMTLRDTGQPYDVFLCHNSREKPAVRTINERLRQEYGLRTYLDEAKLVGGEDWEPSILSALAASSACAVIFG